MDSLQARANHHIKSILTQAIQHTDPAQTLVIFDTQTPLAIILKSAYETALPGSTFLEFQEGASEMVMDAINKLSAKGLVVLIQSTNFRLNEFRIRIELFKRDLKTIEHVHLSRMTEDQFEIYLDALEYDPAYYRTIGPSLKKKLEAASTITVECDGTTLSYQGPMETPKLNIGDYSEMKNVGGTFPIGEVFTETVDLTAVQGEAMVFAFAGEDHIVRKHIPFKVHIHKGVLTPGADAPEEFVKIIDLIKLDEVPYVREFGLGLNRAMTKDTLVNDITAYERMKGLHLSIGEKHSIYNKPGFTRKGGRYHVDVFIDIKQIKINDEVIYNGQAYTV